MRAAGSLREERVVDKVEKLARVIAGAVSGLSPDTRVALGEPFRVRGLYGYGIPVEDLTRPLWSEFVWAAQAVLAAGFDCLDEPAGEVGGESADGLATGDDSGVEVTAAFAGGGGAKPVSAATVAAWRDLERDPSLATDKAWLERAGLA